MRKLLLVATALVASQTAASASNYINLDNPTGNDYVNNLSITQDTTDANASNTISGDGNNPGTSLHVNGPWNGITVNQYGGNNVLKGAITAASASTNPNVTATYGLQTGSSTTGTQGFNTHSLTIGATHAPVDPNVTISVANTAAIPASGNANTITDVLDVSGGGTLTYNLSVTGDSNTIGNTVSGGGNTSVTETVAASRANTVTNSLTAGGTLTYTLAIGSGDSNTVSNTVNASGAVSMNQSLTGASNGVTDHVGNTTQVASYNEALSATGSSNTIANTVNGATAKTVNVTLASSGNTVTNGMWSTAGTQSSTLTANSGSKVNFTLVAGTQANPLGGSSTSSVILNNVIGASGAQGVVNVTQSGTGDNVNLTVNGGSVTVGAGGINVTQSTNGANFTATINAHAPNYALNVHQ